MEAVNAAKTNWAHVAIAQLMKHGYVGRVLTTNFDPLIQRATALVGTFPAVYDLASGPRFVEHFVAPQAVFHLHGQYSGFVLLNTPDAMAKHAEVLQPVFEAIGAGQPWLIAGYSGRNDPVFDQLARFGQFEYNAYWVNYFDEPLEPHVENLLSTSRSAHLVNGYDADTFFIHLARELECFPPEFLGMPFQHMLQRLETLTDWPLETHVLGQPIQDQSIDFLGATKGLVSAASRFFEDGKKVRRGSLASPRALRAAFFFFSGDFDQAIKVAPKKTVDNQLNAIVSQAMAARAGTYLQAAILQRLLPVPEEVRTELKKARERDSSNTYGSYLEGVVATLDAEASIDLEERLSHCDKALRRFRMSREFAHEWPVAYWTWGIALRLAIDAHAALGHSGDTQRLTVALTNLQAEFKQVVEAHDKAVPGSAQFYASLMKTDLAENKELQELLKRPPLTLRTKAPSRAKPGLVANQTTLHVAEPTPEAREPPQ